MLPLPMQRPFRGHLIGAGGDDAKMPRCRNRPTAAELAKARRASHLWPATPRNKERSLRNPFRPRPTERKRAARTAIGAAAVAFLLLGGAAVAQEIGRIGVDWIGNDIVVEAIKDPKVEGVTCHVTYFDRGVIDRLKKGNWFE